MLKYFSRLEKTRNFVLLIIAVIMVASLVLFYAPSRNTDSQANLARSTEAAAKVGSETITVGEIAREKESYSQFGGGRSFPAKMLLDNLIRSRILRLEADRLGLRATDAEVAASIREQFKTEDGKPFDQTRYEQNVTEQFGSVGAYEQAVRDQVSAQKVQAFLTSGVNVSEEEVLSDFQRKNTKFDVSYVSVNTAELAQTIVPSDEDLKAYFEQNKKSYYISVPQKKIRYVFLNTAKIGEKLTISDEELKAEYDKLTPDRKIAGVAGQEIVLRVPKPEFEAQTTEKANQIIERLKKEGDIVSEATFAEVAKGQSENPNTAAAGGKIPGIIRRDQNKQDDPYQRLVTMKPGEITEPISYQGRFFILRRGEDVAKSFEDAKKELDISLRNRRAYEAAAVLADKAVASLKQTKDAQKTAAEFAGQANMTAAEMIRETPYIKPGDNVENVGISPQFETGIAGLENASDVGDKISVQNGFAVPLLVDKKEPRDAEFDEVKGQITEIVKLEKAKAQVEEIAKQIASGAANAAGLTTAAQAKNLKAQEQKAFIIGSPLGQGPSASTSEALENAVFAMKEGEVTKTPLKVGDNWYIVAVNKREDAKQEDFAKQRDTLFATMLGQKRSEVFSDFLSSTKMTMEKAGNIKIYQDAIAKLDAESAVPGMPAGMPGGGGPSFPIQTQQ